MNKRNGKRQAQQGAVKRPKRRSLPLWHRKVTKVGIAALTASSVIAVGLWVWQTGMADQAWRSLKWKAIALSNDHGFTVRDILVRGRRETGREDLLSALRLEPGAPILAFDPDGARRRILELPWIQSVSIERRLPDVVYVEIEERRPIALWQRDGEHILVGGDGALIADDRPERFPGLLHMVGEGAPDHAAELIAILKTQPEMARQVAAAVRIGDRRWNLVMENGITVNLPERSQAKAWTRLATYQRKHDLLSGDIALIDLRLDDRLILRKKPDPERKDRKGKDTRGA